MSHRPPNPRSTWCRPYRALVMGGLGCLLLLRASHGHAGDSLPSEAGAFGGLTVDYDRSLQGFKPTIASDSDLARFYAIAGLPMPVPNTAIPVTFGNITGQPVFIGDWSNVARGVDGSEGTVELPIVKNRVVLPSCSQVDVSVDLRGASIGADAASNLDKVRSATGRIAVLGHSPGKFLGTGWVINPGLVVTNLHVLAAADIYQDADEVWQLGSDLVFEAALAPSSGDDAVPFTVEGIHAVIPNADLVVIDVQLTALNGMPLPPPAPVEAGDWIKSVISLPADRSPLLAAVGFWDLAAVDDRLSGKDWTITLCESQGHHARRLTSYGTIATIAADILPQIVFFHKASTAPGASGSPVVDLRDGRVVGVNACAPDPLLRECPKVVVDAMKNRPELSELNLAWPVSVICKISGICPV